jgi:putative ABC transport system ATP-binding protein
LEHSPEIITGQVLIQLNHIHRHYRMGVEIIRAVQDISLSIMRNEYVALMGPSGSGKSTLMNLIGCLDTATSGDYILNNRVVSEMSDNELAEVRNREIGFVFQTFNLLPRYTALDNVILPLIYAGVSKKDRIERGEEILEKVGLGDRMNHKPNELSGGQCQRVAIGRALITNPSIILADEPTGNLDSKISTEIMALFQKIHEEGNTVILVTHEEDIARYARRIIRLKDGLVESDSTNKDVIRITPN